MSLSLSEVRRSNYQDYLDFSSPKVVEPPVEQQPQPAPSFVPGMSLYPTPEPLSAPVPFVRNARPVAEEEKAKGLGETIQAIRDLALTIILCIVLFKVSLPLAIGTAVYLKTPLAILPMALSAVNIYSIYYFATNALKHVALAWDKLSTITD